MQPILGAAEISPELIDSMRVFAPQREVEHCGNRFSVSAFDFYIECPQCGTRVKLRGFSALPELADIFDTVFEWMHRPENADAALRRQRALEDDVD